jgi:spermidine synthase
MAGKNLNRDSPLRGQSLFVLVVLVIGASGLIAQVLLLRELLVSFYGNELVLGIILANWVILEALGAFLAGKYSDRIKNKLNLFVILQVTFSLALPFSIYLARIFKSLVGVPFGEAIGLSAISYISFLIILPVAFSHGALFSVATKLGFSSSKGEAASAIGNVYAWETIGTLLGGVIFTYSLIPYLNSFQVVCIVSGLNLIICFFFLKNAAKILKYVIFTALVLLLYLPLSGSLTHLQQFSVNKQFPGQKVLDYRNSVYGNIAVTKRQEQLTFFYNGIPVITTPYPDITFVQEFGNLPLLFHDNPKDMFIISGGAGGLLNEALKHSLKRLDYAELDPLIITLLKKYPSPLTEKELNDPRVRVINLDGRFFISNTTGRYDLVLIGLSRPSDLSTNRFFTQEFFALVKKRLNPGGIFAFYLPGSLTYLSRQLKDLNACVLNGLKNTYEYIRIIPGDYNIFLASDSKSITEISPSMITQRINQRKIKTDIFIPSYLEYRLNEKRIEWFRRALQGATKRVNRDLRPVAVYEMLIIWNKQHSGLIAGILESLKQLNLTVIWGLILLVTLGLLFFSRLSMGSLSNLSLAYGIATTGFFGMLISLMLVFAFQVAYGYLYYSLGLLISLFMAGIAVGSLIITANINRIKDYFSLFIKLDIAVLLFSLASGYILIFTIGRADYAKAVFIALFLLSGMFLGLEFPLVGKIYLLNNKQVGESAGSLYAADLFGGWLAGMLGGVVFLPLLGLFNTCLVVFLFKSSSIALLLAARFRSKNPLT